MELPPHPRRCDCPACWVDRHERRKETVWLLWFVLAVGFVLIAWQLGWSDYDLGFATFAFFSLGAALFGWQLFAEGKNPHLWSTEKQPGMLGILVPLTASACAFLLLATTHTDAGRVMERLAHRAGNASEAIMVLLSLLCTIALVVGFGVSLVTGSMPTHRTRTSNAAGWLAGLGGVALLIGTGVGIWWLMHDPWLGDELAALF